MDTLIPPSAQDSEPGLVAATVYVDGQRLRDIPLEDAGAWSRKAGHVVWIGLYEPSTTLLHRLQAQLHLHDLAIEDASKAHQHPKIERYGDALFVVARTAQVIDRQDRLRRDAHLRRQGLRGVGAPRAVGLVRHRAPARRSVPDEPRRGEDYILYSILDFIVDNYAPVVETVQREVDALEDGLLSKALPESAVDRLYTLRRELLQAAQGRGPAGRRLQPPRACRRGADRAADAAVLPRRRRPYPPRPGGHRCRCARCWPSPSRRA